MFKDHDSSIFIQEIISVNKTGDHDKMIKFLLDKKILLSKFQIGYQVHTQQNKLNFYLIKEMLLMLMMTNMRRMILGSLLQGKIIR